MIVNDEKDISSRWKSLLEGKPDFIKVFLNYCDNPKKTGLDPKFLPESSGKRTNLTSRFRSYLHRD